MVHVKFRHEIKRKQKRSIPYKDAKSIRNLHDTYLSEEIFIHSCMSGWQLQNTTINRKTDNLVCASGLEIRKLIKNLIFARGFMSPFLTTAKTHSYSISLRRRETKRLSTNFQLRPGSHLTRKLINSIEFSTLNGRQYSCKEMNSKGAGLNLYRLLINDKEEY